MAVDYLKEFPTSHISREFFTSTSQSLMMTLNEKGVEWGGEGQVYPSSDWLFKGVQHCLKCQFAILNNSKFCC